MKTKYLFIMLISAVFFAGCSSISVNTDYDTGTNFANYKTYSWPTNSEKIKDDDLSMNPIMYNRIKKAVDKELQQIGFVLKEDDGADFEVYLHAGVKEKMQIHDTGPYYRGYYGAWWGRPGGTTMVNYYEEGTLFIDIVDNQKNELTWRGAGTSVLEEYSDIDDQEAFIAEIVSKILQDFPPSSK